LGLHLHRLQDDDRSSGGHLGADGDRGCDDQRRGWRPQHAALVAADPVRYSFHFDKVHRPMCGCQHAESLPGHDQPHAVPAQWLHHDVSDVLLPVGDDGHAESVRAGPRRRDPVGPSTQLEIDRPCNLVLHLRTATTSGLQQSAHLDEFIDLVGLDPRGDERDA